MRFLGKHNAKLWHFWLSFRVKLVINSVLQTVLFSCNPTFTENMVRRKCKHCPIPGCGSKFLARLTDHLTRVHELTELECKYWLQFAKLQNTNVVRVYDKETEPETIFFINESACSSVSQL